MQVLHFTLSKMFLKLSSFFKILFFSFYTLSSKSLILSIASSNLLFNPSSVLFISDIAFFISDWSFFYGFYAFFHALSILIIITLNSLSDKQLASISHSSFEEFSCYFTLGSITLSSHWLLLYIFLYIRYICKDSGIGLCQMLLVTALGNLFGAFSDPQHVAPTASPICL